MECSMKKRSCCFQRYFDIDRCSHFENANILNKSLGCPCAIRVHVSHNHKSMIKTIRLTFNPATILKAKCIVSKDTL